MKAGLMAALKRRRQADGSSQPVQPEPAGAHSSAVLAQQSEPARPKEARGVRFESISSPSVSASIPEVSPTFSVSLRREQAGIESRVTQQSMVLDLEAGSSRSVAALASGKSRMHRDIVDARSAVRDSPANGAAVLEVAQPSAVVQGSQELHGKAAPAVPTSIYSQGASVGVLGGKASVKDMLWLGAGAPADNGRATLEALEKMRGETLPPFQNAKEEEQRARRKAAIRVLLHAGHEMVAAGKAYSRLAPPEPAARAELLIGMVVSLGGKGLHPAASTATALFCEDIQDWLSEVMGASSTPTGGIVGPDIFPIDTEDLRAMRTWLAARVTFTQASLDRMPVAVRMLQELGCRVVFDEALFVPVARKPAGLGVAPNAREAIPPMAVVLLEGWANKAPREVNGECACPHGDYVSHIVCRMWCGGRGGGYHQSRFLKTAEVSAASRQVDLTGMRVAVLCCQEDKGRREDVIMCLPLLGWTSDSNVAPVAWAPPFVASYADHGHMYSDFKPGPGAGRPSAAKSITGPSAWLHMQVGESTVRKPAAAPKAAKAVADAFVMASGKGEDWLREHRLSGTHPERHVVAVVSALAKWPEGPEGSKHADALGDWAPPPAALGRGARGAPKSSRTLYVPNSNLKTQVEARARFSYMMQAAFSLWDVEGLDPAKKRLTWDTTWNDLFPPDPPAILKPFYGEPTVEHFPEVKQEAAIVGVTFEPPRPPKAQGAVATRRKRRAQQ
jgi:hypothetical protein